MGEFIFAARRMRTKGCAIVVASAVLAMIYVLPAAANTVTVTVGPGLSFSPASITINVGDTVNWVWAPNGFLHSTTSGACCTPDGKWDSGQGVAPKSFSFTFTSAGTFPYFCSVHLSQMTGTVIVVAPPPPPNYSMSVSNPLLKVFPNQLGTFHGTLTALNGYSSAVSVACGLGAPVTCGSDVQTPTAVGQPFNIGASDSRTQDFNFSLNATGSDVNRIPHSAPVTFRVWDFGLAPPSPSTLAVQTTQTSAALPVGVTALNGFTGPVTLGCAGLPANASCVFNLDVQGSHPTVNLSGASTAVSLQVITSGAATGNYPITITANSPGGTQKTQGFTLQVVGVTIGALSSPSLALPPTGSSSGADTFALTSVNGFTGNVFLSCAVNGMVSVSCQFTPANPVTLAANGTATVGYKISTNSVPTGNYTVTLTALANGELLASKDLALIVEDYQLAMTNLVSVVFPGQSGSFNGTLTSNGYNSSVNLTCSGQPAACNFLPSASVIPTAGGAAFTAIPTTAVGTAAQNYPITITGTGTDPSTIMHSQVVTLSVVDFQLIPPANQTAVDGNPTAPLTVQVKALGAFHGAVDLSCPAAKNPVGFACNFSPASVEPTVAGVNVNLVVTTPKASASANPYSITIEGTPRGTGAAQESTQFHDAAFNLTVNSGTGSADLAVTLGHVPSQSPDVTPVGQKLTYNLSLQDKLGGTIPSTVVITFVPEVAFGTVPINCTKFPGYISCPLTTQGTTLQTIAIETIVPFARSIAAMAFASSGSVQTVSTDAMAVDNPAAQVRPRPLSRQGLPPKLP